MESGGRERERVIEILRFAKFSQVKWQTLSRALCRKNDIAIRSCFKKVRCILSSLFEPHFASAISVLFFCVLFAQNIAFDYRIP